MKAVILRKAVTARELITTQVPLPKVKPGHILVKIKAFGINRSEIYTRNGFSPSVSLPRILGIECVGEIFGPSDSALKKGQRVISMMGGLGREFDGSYAEYALIPTEQIYPVNTKFEWEELAAVPEMYYTAWCSLIDTLKLKKNESLLIRGGTSSVGIASLQIAKAIGAKVITTTRNKEKINLLLEYGADHVLIDDSTLSEQVKTIEKNGADKILELIGTISLHSSFGMLKHGGIICMTGILGGEWELKKFAPMDFIPSGSYLTIFDSKTVFPDSLQSMLDFLDEKHIKPHISNFFSLDEIAQAHLLMESNTANGKIIIVNQ